MRLPASCFSKLMSYQQEQTSIPQPKSPKKVKLPFGVRVNFRILSIVPNRPLSFYTKMGLIIAQNRSNSHIFIYCEQTKRYIQKSKKSLPAAFGNMYSAYLFFSLWLPNFSVPAFEISHKITSNMG